MHQVLDWSLFIWVFFIWLYCITKKRFIRQLRCFGKLICIPLSKQMFQLCGGVLLLEYLDRWFHVSVSLPVCSSVTLIDWIHCELLTRLKTMCAVQLNRAWSQIFGLWQPPVLCGLPVQCVCPATVFTLPNGCLLVMYSRLLHTG